MGVARCAVRGAVLAAGIAVLCASHAAAQSAEDLVGRWRLTLDTGRVEHSGLLEVEPEGAELSAFVDGGPVTFEVGRDAIAMEIDTRDGGGRLLSYRLTGAFDGRAMSGTLAPPLDAPEGRWRAERIAETDQSRCE
jgi:hypothetical protein